MSISMNMEQAVRRLFELCKVESTIQEMLGTIIGQMFKALDMEDKEVQQIVVDHVKERIPHAIERAIPIYGKYFTMSELNKMVAFYETEVGQKLLNIMPAIMLEQQAATHEIFASSIDELQEKIEEVYKKRTA